MELFFSNNLNNDFCILDEQESIHCMRVLRHTIGDRVNVIDGCGNLLHCVISEFRKREVVCSIVRVENNYGSHPYKLTMAVAPTKNIDRYEWFLEKGCELGMDKIVPVIGEFSERKTVNHERLLRVLVSAVKQSQKAKIPELTEPISIADFINRNEKCNTLKVIAYCGDCNKISLSQAVMNYKCAIPLGVLPEIIIMIGPEGDFSPREANAAISAGFVAVHLGESRLRTETAAVAAVTNIYFSQF